MAFPNTFADNMRPLPENLGEIGAATAAELAERGFVVEAGLTPYLAGAIGQIATQEHIKEYCPKDETAARFESEASTAEWLTKNGGRAMFGIGRVLGNGSRRWVGYGWTGPEESEELSDCHVTFAVRLGKEGLGNGLAVPFTKLIVIGSAALYGARDIGLETWASNKAAKKYEDAGFIFVGSEKEKENERSTLRAVGDVIMGHEVYLAEDGKHMVKDRRRHARYPNELLGLAA
jgi:hypothetical protein